MAEPPETEGKVTIDAHKPTGTQPGQNILDSPATESTGNGPIVPRQACGMNDNAIGNDKHTPETARPKPDVRDGLPNPRAR